MRITVSDLAPRLYRPLTVEEEERAGVLLEDAAQLIRDEFRRHGRDLDAELDTVPWLPGTFRRVVLEMVGAAVLTGGPAGVRSISSTTGPTSDSITYAKVPDIGWASVVLTDEQREALGLGAGGPRGYAPGPIRWPERRLRCRRP